MASTTLTSLAMLKVNVDQGRDYLDYLRPFILQVLVDHKPDPVTDSVVRDHLRSQFGLEIPTRAVQIILRRLSRAYSIERVSGVYRVRGALPDPGVTMAATAAARHISAVVKGLMNFAEDSGHSYTSEDEAVAAICAFLSEFNVPFLRAYLRGTAIPDVDGRHGGDIVLVSQYILHLQDTDPERFESLVIMVQGHMLANALLCPDLQNAQQTYRRVTFYFDTPLLVRRLGAEGQPSEASMRSLIDLLHNLGATVATFAHSRQELENVLRGAAQYIDSPEGRGAIVFEARRNGTSKSDLLVLAGQVDEQLDGARIEVHDTPEYIARFQIDEEVYGDVLDDEVSYFNPKAKEYDINSVRSIYVLREHTAPATLENSKAVLVTSNAGFARAAFEYGQRYEESREVSSVITDFSLANMAWLKAPLGAPALPTAEIIAFSYAALRPSPRLLNKYMQEIDKLEERGMISAKDHQLLRSSTIAHDELMRLTLGEEAALTEATVTETLKRVTTEIKREETAKLSSEQESHRETQAQLAAERAQTEELQRRVFWRCKGRAKLVARAGSAGLAALLILGLGGGLGLTGPVPIIGWIVFACSVVFSLTALANLVVGTTVKGLYEAIEANALSFFLRTEARALGLSVPDADK